MLRKGIIPDPPSGEPAGSQEASWYVVRTHAQAESVAAEHLARQGYIIFLPLRRRRIVRHARKVTVRNEVYFPRYMFVRFDPRTDRWRPIDSTRGVAGLVRSAGAPTPVARGVVDALLDLTDADGFLQTSQPLAVGQKVRMLSGPFAEQIGRLDDLSGADAALVLLSMMNRTVRVRMPVSEISAVAEAAHQR